MYVQGMTFMQTDTAFWWLLFKSYLPYKIFTSHNLTYNKHVGNVWLATMVRDLRLTLAHQHDEGLEIDTNMHTCMSVVLIFGLQAHIKRLYHRQFTTGGYVHMYVHNICMYYIHVVHMYMYVHTYRCTYKFHVKRLYLSPFKTGAHYILQNINVLECQMRSDVTLFCVFMFTEVFKNNSLVVWLYRIFWKWQKL
jgi:hypothetical protein